MWPSAHRTVIKSQQFRGRKQNRLSSDEKPKLTVTQRLHIYPWQTGMASKGYNNSLAMYTFLEDNFKVQPLEKWGQRAFVLLWDQFQLVYEVWLVYSSPMLTKPQSKVTWLSWHIPASANEMLIYNWNESPHKIHNVLNSFGNSQTGLGRDSTWHVKSRWTLMDEKVNPL